MLLPARSREYVTWTITGADGATELSVSFDDGVTWHPLEATTGDDYRLLVAGPEAASNPGGTVVLPVGRTKVLVSAADTPESIIRPGGVIDVD